jgi:hypothetical protein
MVVTTDELLAGVKRRGIIASNTSRLDDDDLLALIDGVIKTTVVPFLDSCNGNFFVRTDVIPIVAGQSSYDIPYRAVGRSLRDLKMQSSTGDNTWRCPQIGLENSHREYDGGESYRHYFLGDQFVLVPDVKSNYSLSENLLISYKIMPNKLVKLSLAAKVSSVSDPSVSVESVGDIITGSTVDFIAGKSGNRIYSFDAIVTNVSGTTLTFGSDVIPSDLSSGDYISIAQTSPVVTMIPDEVSPWIEILSVRKALQALGDTDGANEVMPDIQIEKENLNKILEPRNEGETIPIINRNSLVRGRVFDRARFRYGGSV